MNESFSPPSGLLRAYAAAAKWLLWLALTAWLVLALGWGVLHELIVPRIGELRPDLEIEAGRVLGVPVRIGAITARSEGLVPSFELRDVVLIGPEGREALRLPRVVVSLSPRSLWNLGFDQLYIEQPEVDIRRAADGKIFVAGLDFSRGGANDGRAADWFFNQTEFVVRGGTLRWTDEMRAAAPLALRNVDFVMRNSARRHALRLDATPPAEWGDRFSLRGLFRQPLLSAHHGRWQEWDGQLHADFSGVDLSQLRRHVDLDAKISSGRGALRAWADVAKGQVNGGVADLVLTDVSATLGPDLAPLMFNSLSGRLGGKRLAGGFEFETRDLQFQTREGQRWPGGNVFVQWAPAEGKTPAQGQLRADKLDLAAVSLIAGRLPLGAVTHEKLAAYAPQGLIESLQAKWQGPLDAPQKYEARGRAVRLAIGARGSSAARPGHASGSTPGLRGAAIEFEVTEAGGKGKLALQQGALDLPGVFEDPVIPFDRLSADLQWKIDGAQLSASVSQLTFSNADGQGEGQASWRSGETLRNRFPGALDLQASVNRLEAVKVWRYLPLGLPKATRDYVREAVLGGVASDARFRVKGELRDFPFGHGRPGEFRISTQVRNATFAFVPPRLTGDQAGWPALTGLSGELLFDRNTMQVKRATGGFAGAPGLQVKAEAEIADLRASIVSVKGEVRGPLSESLGIVNQSPLAGLMGKALARASATGDAEVRLQLALPLAGIEKSQVQGSVTLAGNDLRITPDTPLLARARGTVTFNERGFALAGAQARMLGGEVRLEGASPGVVAATGGAGAGPAATATGAVSASAVSALTEPSITLRAQGTATAEGLRQAGELGFLSRLAKHASGGALYNATLAIRQGTSDILVQSNLQGMALNLPPPLAKAAEAVLPLRFEQALLRDPQAPQTGSTGSVARPQDQLSVELGRVASVVYVRDLSGAEPRVVRGSIGVGLAPGESAPLPDQGVLANVNLAGVNVDAWETVLTGIAGNAGASAASGATAGASAVNPARPATAADAWTGYLPTVMAVRARELTVQGRTLHNVVVGGSREGINWRANVDSSELNGYVEYRQPAAAAAGRVYARLARLTVAAAAASDVELLLDEQPTNIPTLDLVVDDFELRGKKLGRLEIDAVNRGAQAMARDGGLREWRLNKLGLSMPEGVFNATGNWAAVTDAGLPTGSRAAARPLSERRRTTMNFRLDIADSGQLLGRFGMKDVIRRGKGKMEGQVAWLGSPLSLDYPSMTGTFNVNVEAGQFMKADPGLAKLLGVLSLQSLPRRFSLDFRDVFSQGFAFDFVRGDITIQQGIAATNNLQMKGVNAAVLLEGKADIAKETQHIQVVVIPEINAGTASLITAVINPALGLGTFLAQLFLREPLMRAATQQFHIDGTWADPRVTKVSRQPAPGTEGRAAPVPDAQTMGNN